MSLISTRAGAAADAGTLALIHIDAFPGYFLSALGPEFLTRYYRVFAESPHTLVVGVVDGEVVGFVAGTSDVGQFHRDLYRPNLLAFAAIVVRRCASDPAVRREIGRRVRHVWVAAKSVLTRRRTSGSSERREDVSSTLFSIAATAESRGSGVADEMMDAFAAAEREHGVKRITLSVADYNPRAIAFYERRGWREVEREGVSIVYELDLS